MDMTIDLQNKYKVFNSFANDLLMTLDEIQGIKLEKTYASDLLRDSSNFISDLDRQSAKQWIFDNWDLIPSFLKGNSFVLRSINIESVFDNPIAFVTVIYEEFLDSVSMHVLFHELFKKEESSFRIQELRFATIDDKFIANVERILNSYKI